MKKPSRPKTSAPVVPADSGAPAAEEKEPLPTYRKKGRITKSAQVDEQIFQEGLSVQLDNERWQNRGDETPSSSKQSKKNVAKQAGQVSDAILEEFQSMIDGMLPSAKQEQLACMQPVGKDKSASSKKKQKKRGDKKSQKAALRKKNTKKKRDG